jgi:hypothetical protein
VTQLNEPSARIDRDSPMPDSNTFEMTSFAHPTTQLPWNDILAKNIGGWGSKPQISSNQLDGLRPRSAPMRGADGTDRSCCGFPQRTQVALTYLPPSPNITGRRLIGRYSGAPYAS